MSFFPPALESEITITPEIQAVMDELGLPMVSIQLGLSKGYQARVINVSLPVAPGNVIWAPRHQLDSVWGHFGRRLYDTEFEAYQRGLQEGQAKKDDLIRDAHAQGYRVGQARMADAVSQSYDRGYEEGMKKKAPATMGQLAYERRCQGEKWSDIGPCSFGNARAYAKSHHLSWPPRPNDGPKPI